nr:ADP-ribosylglycohydrolase family protein [Bifidobacterium choloepi]
MKNADPYGNLDAIHELGEGWVAEETLAIAVFCAVRHENDFRAGVLASVNHRGDSDSTGAVAGNIFGARLGVDAIPAEFLANLEARDLVDTMAQDLVSPIKSLAENPPAVVAKEDVDWENKYIYCSYSMK